MRAQSDGEQVSCLQQEIERGLVPEVIEIKSWKLFPLSGMFSTNCRSMTVLGLNTWSNVALYEHVDARSRQRGTYTRGASIGQEARYVAGLPSQRDQHFQIWMKLLELLDRAEISVERGGIRLAADAGQS